MDHIDLAGKLGQVARLFHRGITTTNHCKHLVAVHRKCTITHRACTDAAAIHGEADLVGQAHPVGGRAGRNNHTARQHCLAVRINHSKWLLGEITLINVGVDHSSAKSLRLLAELGHHVWTRNAMRKARVVLNFGSQHQLPTWKHRRRIGCRHAHIHHRVKVGAGCVDGRGPTSGTGSNDH